MKKNRLFEAVMMTALCAAAIPARAEATNERALVAYLKVQAGMEQPFLNAAKDIIKESRKESGCLIYILHESETDPQQFLFYELYKTDADLKAHRQSKHVVDFLKTVDPMLVPGQFVLDEFDPK